MYHYHISDSHRNKINNMFYNEIHYATITMKFQLYLDNYIYLFIGEQSHSYKGAELSAAKPIDLNM